MVLLIHEKSIQYSREPAESFRKYVKNKKRRLGIKIAVITALVVMTIVMIRLIAVGALVAFLALDGEKAEVLEDTDISHYSWYIGENAGEEYAEKWGMKEDIFPEEITNEMRVTDYKMVYYNPWDAQYLKSQPYGLTTGSAGGLDEPLRGIFRYRL